MLKKYIRKGETVAEFAEALGVSRKQLYLMFKNPEIIRFKDIWKISELTGIKPDKISREINRFKN